MTDGETRHHAAAEPGRISVARLSLSDFRCFHSLRLEIGAASVVVTGPNGAGKTTILEALSFLAPGSGLRRARLDEVARRTPPDGPGVAEWAVAVRLRAPGSQIEIGTGRVAGGVRDRRVVRIDGRPARSLSVLASALGVVWLTPDMDRLFQGSGGARRRFFDRIVFGADPAHADRVAAFDKAMRERARLLRDGRRDPVWLEALENTMAQHGVAAAAARLQVASRLAALCRDDAGSFPGARLAVEGPVERWLAAGPALAAEDRMRSELAASRRRDAETGSTAVGPHRSDLAVRHARTGRPAAACSTGEQKMLLIALVLAGARLRAAETGRRPLLLLDDVAAHLDAGHRAVLFDEIDAIGAQAWYTGTDRTVFSPLRHRAQWLAVDNAAVVPEDRSAPD